MLAPLTFDQKRDLRPGDRVRVRTHLGHEIDYTVRTAPVWGASGDWVVGYAEAAGNYLLDDVLGRLNKEGT